jgi:hypothetical protein
MDTEFYGYHHSASLTAPDAFTQFVYPGWFRSAPIQNTLVEVYLQRRGINLIDLDVDWHASLRFDHSAYHSKVKGTKCNWPGMVAIVFGFDWPGESIRYAAPIGTTITYLEADGRKLDQPGFLARKFVGGSHIVGGGVWFGVPHPDEPFVVGEGIETTLSAMVLFGARAGVATLAANFLPVVKLPDAAKTLIVAADHDDERSRNIGYRKAAYAAARWRAQGRRVSLKRPHEPGVDFNDILRRRRGLP